MIFSALKRLTWFVSILLLTAASAAAADPEPTLKRMRELFANRQWMELVNEFGTTDFASWPSRQIGRAHV